MFIAASRIEGAESLGIKNDPESLMCLTIVAFRRYLNGEQVAIDYLPMILRDVADLVEEVHGVSCVPKAIF